MLRNAHLPSGVVCALGVAVVVESGGVVVVMVVMRGVVVAGAAVGVRRRLSCDHNHRDFYTLYKNHLSSLYNK